MAISVPSPVSFTLMVLGMSTRFEFSTSCVKRNMTRARKLCCRQQFHLEHCVYQTGNLMCTFSISTELPLEHISPWINGTPNSNLCQDKEAQVDNTSKFISVPLAHERVTTKVFNHYAIPLEISDTIQAAFKAKLQWM